MTEHQFSGEIPVASDRIFSYVADVANLPTYLPLMTGAHHLGGEQVEIETNVKGHDVRMPAWFRSDPANRRIDWGSSANDGYFGWLEVVDGGGTSTVNFHLTTPLDHDLEPYFRAATAFMTNALVHAPTPTD